MIRQALFLIVLLCACLLNADGRASNPSAYLMTTAGNSVPAPALPNTASDSMPQSDSIAGIVARGKYLVAAGDCVSCHTRRDGEAFAGGVGLETPLGTIYSSNLTPDNETGIGTWTAADLRSAMHEGIGRDGRRLFPAFPYTSFTKVSDLDVDAIYAYLRTLKAVRYSPPHNGILFTQRWVMAIWNALFFKAGRFKPNATQTADWNTGAYLVQGLGHCGACHTPRNMLLAEIADRAFAGGTLTDAVAPNKSGPWFAVNLTPAQNGLASWSLDDLAKYLKTGYSQRAGAFGPMVDVIVNGTMQLSSDDVRAMSVYLKSLPAKEGRNHSVVAEQTQLGGAIYKERCEKCHMSSGRGGFLTGPALAGSAVVQADDPTSLINIILYGQGAPKALPSNVWESMKPYADVLSDDEVSAVNNYVRASWKNRAPPVKTREVARQR
jgi:mono/diheme cytochrome c family protein